ncbi:hypothetical protein [Lysobacter gummosus]|uniref:hypothetical protein n=1 Tax=Lysobacter gummosus TaxID=262324 RepID=UPI003629F5C6
MHLPVAPNEGRGPCARPFSGLARQKAQKVSARRRQPGDYGASSREGRLRAGRVGARFAASSGEPGMVRNLPSRAQGR